MDEMFVEYDLYFNFVYLWGFFCLQKVDIVYIVCILQFLKF